MDKYEIIYNYRPITCPGGQTITYYAWGKKACQLKMYTQTTLPQADYIVSKMFTTLVFKEEVALLPRSLKVVTVTPGRFRPHD